MRFETRTFVFVTILLAGGVPPAMAGSSQPNYPVIEFKKDVALSPNKSGIELSMPTTLVDKDSSCTIHIKTPPFSAPHISAGRQLAVSTTSLGLSSTDADLIDLKTSQVIGSISCEYDRQISGFSDAMRDTFGAEPVGGLKKYDIKYDPATDESPLPAEKADSTVAI